MTTTIRTVKMLIAGLVLALSVFVANPAFAQKADIEMLESYVGTWKGRGTLTRNGTSEPMTCLITFRSDSPFKLLFSSEKPNRSRCIVAGASIGIAGAIVYVPERKLYEAVITSGTPFKGVAVGKRRGKNINFKLNDVNAETGDKFKIEAAMQLRSGVIELNFYVTNVTTGGKATVAVPLKKQT